MNKAPCYTKEHLTGDRLYELLLCTEAICIIKVKIQSRHSKNATHILWIQYVKGLVIPLIGLYRTRKKGGLVVGCCAHIACVFWSLDYDRHDNTSKQHNLI